MLLGIIVFFIRIYYYLCIKKPRARNSGGIEGFNVVWQQYHTTNILKKACISADVLDILKSGSFTIVVKAVATVDAHGYVIYLSDALCIVFIRQAFAPLYCIYNVGSALLVLLRWANARASGCGTSNDKTPTFFIPNLSGPRVLRSHNVNIRHIYETPGIHVGIIVLARLKWHRHWNAHCWPQCDFQ